MADVKEQMAVFPPSEEEPIVVRFPVETAMNHYNEVHGCLEEKLGETDEDEHFRSETSEDKVYFCRPDTTLPDMSQSS